MSRVQSSLDRLNQYTHSLKAQVPRTLSCNPIPSVCSHLERLIRDDYEGLLVWNP